MSLTTVEQFLELPEEEGIRRELIGGEIIEMADARQPHEIVKSNFLQKLGAFLDAKPIGRLMGETSYRITPHDCPQPDVSVILGDRLVPGHTGFISYAPDIAIEVVSLFLTLPSQPAGLRGPAIARLGRSRR